MIALAIVALLAAGSGDRLVEVRDVLKVHGRGAASFLFQDDQRWDRLLRDIATGQKEWLAIAAELRAGADGGAGETLSMAVQEALPRNPVGVLRLVSLGRFDVQGVCGNYGFGQIEDERPVSVLLGLVAKRVEAVSRVKNEDLRVARAACLDELAKQQRLLKGAGPDNNGLEQSGREGVPASRAVVVSAPCSSTQCSAGTRPVRSPPLKQGMTGGVQILGLLVLVLLQGCERPAPVSNSSTSQSFSVGDHNVLVESHSRNGRVTWVAVRNWPVSAGAVKSHEDTRITPKPQGGCCLIRRQTGELLPPDAEPRLYFFDGAQLTTFKIRVEQAGAADLSVAQVKSYKDVLAHFQRFEVRS